MSDDRHERTFDPSPKRLQKAREEGRVTKSREIPTAAVVLAAGAAFALTGDKLAMSLTDLITAACRGVSRGGDPSTAAEVLGASVGHLGLAVAPFFALVMVAAVASHVGQTGMLLVPSLLLPKLSRIDPFSRLKDVLGPTQALIRTGTALLKVAFVGLVVALVLEDEIRGLELASTRDLGALCGQLATATVRALVAAGAALAVIAVIDWLIQRHKFLSEMRMTREEVKRENREEEGTPEMKARRRSRHRELSLNRILVDVPKADVIVTNPTHYAVALRYRQGKDAAPRVVAKGADAVALHIRAVARKHGVPVVENRPLARALHAKVKEGKLVPVELFKAVAEVLAHVYRLRGRRRSA